MHHPAEDPADPGLAGGDEVRVGAQGVDERTGADADGGRTGDQHHEREDLAPTLVGVAALARDDGDPEGDESHAAEADVQDDEGPECGRYQRFHPRNAAPVLCALQGGAGNG